MEENILGIGKMENNMVLEFIQEQIQLREKESGLMVN